MDTTEVLKHLKEIIRRCDNSPRAISNDGKIDVSAIKSNERDLCDIRALAEEAMNCISNDQAQFRSEST